MATVTYTPDTRVALGPAAAPVEAKPKDGLTLIGVLAGPLIVRLVSNTERRRVAVRMLLDQETVSATVKATGLPRPIVAAICHDLAAQGKRPLKPKAK